MSNTLLFSFFTLLSSAYAITGAAPACADITSFLPLSTYSPAVSYCINLRVDGQSTATSTSTISTTDVATIPVTITTTIQIPTTITSIVTATQVVDSTSTTTLTISVPTTRPETSTSIQTITITTVSTSTVTSQLPGKRNALPTTTEAKACTTRPPICTTYVITSLIPRTSAENEVYHPAKSDTWSSVSVYSRHGAEDSSSTTLTGRSTMCTEILSKSAVRSSWPSKSQTEAHMTQTALPHPYHLETSKADPSACSKKTRHSARPYGSVDAYPSAGTTNRSAPASMSTSCTSTASLGVSSGSARVSSLRPSSTAAASTAVDTLAPLLSSLTTLSNPYQTSVCGCIGATPSCSIATITKTSTATIFATARMTVSETATVLTPVTATTTTTISTTSSIGTSTSTTFVIYPVTVTFVTTATSTATSVTTTTVAPPQATCISSNRCDQVSQQSFRAICDTSIARDDRDYTLFSQQSRANAESCQALCAFYEVCEAYDFTSAIDAGCRLYMNATPARKNASRLGVYMTNAAAGYVSGVYRGDCQQ